MRDYNENLETRVAARPRVFLVYGYSVCCWLVMIELCGCVRCGVLCMEIGDENVIIVLYVGVENLL